MFLLSLERRVCNQSSEIRFCNMSRQNTPLQLIDSEGVLNESGLTSFVERENLAQCGINYAVVAVIGPQSSGKSTLLNRLFSTSFREMDSSVGISQTTQGVWIARGAGVEPCTILLDFEGTDGGERGEGTVFEKQSSLLALAVADVLVINMWCHDIGREQAASKPLLRIIFQVMMDSLSPRKITLIFVLRDRTKTPIEHLQSKILENVQNIWNTVSKSPNYEGTLLFDCFNVKVTALANYEDKPDMFEGQVADLRKQFNDSIAPRALADDRREGVPGAVFALRIQSIWKRIKENRDLHLPSINVLVAKVKCQEVADEELEKFASDQEWIDLNTSATAGEVGSRFGAEIDALIDKHLAEYDRKVNNLDTEEQYAKRKRLVSGVLDKVRPAYDAVVSYCRKEALEKFKRGLGQWQDSPNEHFVAAVERSRTQAVSDFDKDMTGAQVSQAQWDSSEHRGKLLAEIEGHSSTVIAARAKAFEEAVRAMAKEAARALAAEKAARALEEEKAARALEAAKAARALEAAEAARALEAEKAAHARAEAEAARANDKVMYTFVGAALGAAIKASASLLGEIVLGEVTKSKF